MADFGGSGHALNSNVEIDNVHPCILFNVTKIICTLDFLSGTAYHEINENVHVHGTAKDLAEGSHLAHCT